MCMSKKDAMKKINVRDSSIGNYRKKLGQKHGQLERLNPRDHIEDKLEMICDSPNSEYK